MSHPVGTRTIFVIGSSHSRRLGTEFRKIVPEQFYVKNMAIGGATYDRIQYPQLSQISVNDVIVMQGFGNDLFKPAHEYKKGMYHLLACIPTPRSKLEKIFNEFLEWCKSVPCKVIILGLIPRFYHCCLTHKYAGLVSHQVRSNELLARLSNKVPNVVFVHSMKALGVPHRLWKSTDNSMTADNVHLKPEKYEVIARYIFQIIQQ